MGHNMIGRTSEIGKDGISGRPTPGDGWVKKRIGGIGRGATVSSRDKHSQQSQGSTNNMGETFYMYLPCNIYNKGKKRNLYPRRVEGRNELEGGRVEVLL